MPRRSTGSARSIMADPALFNVGDPDLGQNGETWVGAMNGLADGNESTARTRIVGGINQAFDQSPYLSGGGPSPAN